jgi:hypothetical protein
LLILFLSKLARHAYFLKTNLHDRLIVFHDPVIVFNYPIIVLSHYQINLPVFIF